MEALFDTASLSKLFVPTVPLIEAFLRGTIVYLALFAMFRFLAQRGSVASASLTDFLVLVLVTTAVQNAVAADYTSITDGIILALIVVLWSYAIDWLSHRFRPMRRFAFPRSVKLVEDGKLLQENMKRAHCRGADIQRAAPTGNRGCPRGEGGSYRAQRPDQRRPF
jgi:uncharacterized membrane protein YcaP (DUF421 family)